MFATSLNPTMSSPIPLPWSPELVGTLDRALRVYIAGGTEDEIRPVLRSYSREAMAKRMTAARTLVSLKELCGSHADLADVEYDERVRRMERLVSMWIEEYYQESVRTTHRSQC